MLLAYSKMWLFDELLASDLPEDPWVGTALARYFPSVLKEKFGGLYRAPSAEARDRRDACAEQHGQSRRRHVRAPVDGNDRRRRPLRVVRAYLLTREIFGLVPVWQAIESLDNVVPDELQSQMLIELGRRTVRATTWFLRSRRLAEPMSGTIERFAPAAAALLQFIAAAPSSAPWRAPIAQHEQALVAKGVPSPLALAVAASDTSFAALDIAEVCRVVEAAAGCCGQDIFLDRRATRTRTPACTGLRAAGGRVLAGHGQGCVGRRSGGVAARAHRRCVAGRRAKRVGSGAASRGRACSADAD